jgi:hypothetical protein
LCAAEGERPAGIDIFVDDVKTDYVSHMYRHHSLITIHGLSKGEVQHKEEISSITGGMHRGQVLMCRNMAKALSVASDYGDRGVLFLEDDVIFRDGAFTTLSKAVAEIEKRDIFNYVLSLWARHAPKQSDILDKEAAIYPAIDYRGNQAIYFTSSHARSLASFIQANGVVEMRSPSDNLIREQGIDMENIYTTVVDLIDHVGKVSTGLGGPARRARDFY